ncbi:MAG TPA: hypothetical protein VJL39_02910 [Candidatus Paceibacterota bacterium]
MTEVVSPLREVAGLADGAKTWTALVKENGKDVEHLFVECQRCGTRTMRQKVLRIEREDFEQLRSLRLGSSSKFLTWLFVACSPLWALLPLWVDMLAIDQWPWLRQQTLAHEPVAFGLAVYFLIIAITILLFLWQQMRLERTSKAAQKAIFSKYGITKKSDVILGSADLLPKFTGWIALPKE